MSELQEVVLNYNDLTFTIAVDEETHTALMNDDEMLANYSKIVYDKMVVGKDKSKKGTSCSEMNEETQAVEDNFKWSESTINLLIEIRLRRDGEFSRPRIKKRKIWQSIADEMNRVGNYNLSGEMCDSKFRNLANTYRVNKKKQMSSGEDAVTWEYFEKMDEVLGSTFMSETLDFPLECTVVAEESVVSAPPSPPSAPSPPTAGGPSRKRHQIDITEYLNMKLKKDEEISKKKLMLKEKIWAEKKQLKEKEILAIMKLAKALNK